VTDHTIELPDGRTVGFAEHGAVEGTPVLWCHGGPGSRLEPLQVARAAEESGFRLIGIDRPGYGRSTPQPDRTIAGWVPEALTVLDYLDIDQFFTVGVSTGGAYALALAALEPDRVLGVIACCALTDMRWEAARAKMSGPHALDVWDAPDRERAMAAALASHGADGSKMFESAGDVQLAASDLAVLGDPEWLALMGGALPEMYAFGVEGYTDDRRADGPGWETFDTAAITSPVVVAHGGSDIIVDVSHAHHTAEIVPNADLRVFDELGHFSIIYEVVPALADLRAR
jgi:pimeloyl-ACP methyl ester carboxylesterase